MSFYCNSHEALEHKRTCKKNPNYCDECVWIDESSNAMHRYGKVMKAKLTKQINNRIQEKKKFLKHNSDNFESFEDKVNYIKQLFNKGE